MLKKEKYQNIMKYGRKAQCSYGEWKHWTKLAKEKLEKKIKERVQRKATKAGSKQVFKAVPGVGYAGALGFMLYDYLIEKKSAGESFASNIPYVGAAYEFNEIYSELNNIDSIFEQEIMDTSELLNLSDFN